MRRGAQGGRIGRVARRRQASGKPAESAEERGAARTIFGGFALGLLYKAAMSGQALERHPRARVRAAAQGRLDLRGGLAELLGVGYIIGPRISATMFAGACSHSSSWCR